MFVILEAWNILMPIFCLLKIGQSWVRAPASNYVAFILGIICSLALFLSSFLLNLQDRFIVGLWNFARAPNLQKY